MTRGTREEEAEESATPRIHPGGRNSQHELCSEPVDPCVRNAPRSSDSGSALAFLKAQHAEVLHKLKEEVASLQQKNRDLNYKVVLLEDDAQDAGVLIDTLRQRAADGDARVLELQSREAQLEKEQKLLLQQVKVSGAQKRILEEALEERDGMLHAVSEENKALMQKITALATEVAALKTTLEEKQRREASLVLAIHGLKHKQTHPQPHGETKHVHSVNSAPTERALMDTDDAHMTHTNARPLECTPSLQHDPSPAALHATTSHQPSPPRMSRSSPQRRYTALSRSHQEKQPRSLNGDMPAKARRSLANSSAKPRPCSASTCPRPQQSPVPPPSLSPAESANRSHIYKRRLSSDLTSTPSTQASSLQAHGEQQSFEGRVGQAHPKNVCMEKEILPLRSSLTTNDSSHPVYVRHQPHSEYITKETSRLRDLASEGHGHHEPVPPIRDADPSSNHFYRNHHVHNQRQLPEQQAFEHHSPSSTAPVRTVRRLPIPPSQKQPQREHLTSSSARTTTPPLTDTS